MNKYVSKIKEMLNSDKRTQSFLIFILLVVALLYVGSNIFSKEEVTSTGPDNISIETASKGENIEAKLENILSKINGISDVSVMINYSSSDKIVPVYDIKENTDEEIEGTSKSTKSVTQKSVAYQENNGDKIVVVESTKLAVPEGAIVVGSGVSVGDNISKIKEAVSCITGIPIFKVSVFEK